VAKSNPKIALMLVMTYSFLGLDRAAPMPSRAFGLLA
jgi:hypothetical protein